MKKLLFLSVLISLFTALVPLLVWAAQPSDETLALAETHLCAHSATARVKATEAATCVDCSKGANNFPTHLPVLSEQETARINRDLAFFRWYEKYNNVVYTYSACQDSLVECEKTVNEAQAAVDTMVKKLESNESDLTGISATLSELDGISKGIGLTEKGREIVRKVVSQLSEKAKPSESFLEWVSGSCDKLPTDLQMFEKLKEKLHSQSKDKMAFSTYYQNQITSRKLRLGIYEKKLVEWKSKPIDPTIPTEGFALIQYQLKKLEKRYSEKGLSETTFNPGFQECGLSVAERWAIKYYTLDLFLDLNAALRAGGTKLEEFRWMREVLDSGLKKLGTFQGDVVRGGALPTNVLAEYQPGHTVTMTAYTSASLVTGFEGPHQFVIRSRSGHYIAPFSNEYKEFEVIFEPGAKFKVLDREEVDDQIKFVLEQVDSNSSPEEIPK